MSTSITIPTDLSSLIHKRGKRAVLIHDALEVLAKEVLDPAKLANYPLATKLRLFELFSKDEEETVKVMTKLDVAKTLAALEVAALYQKINALSQDQKFALSFASSSEGLEWLEILAGMNPQERSERLKQLKLPIPKTIENSTEVAQ